MFNKLYEKFKRFIKENYKSIIFLIFFFLLFYVKLPFSIYTPGGAINISERIDVPDAYESDGSLNMAYVKSVKASIPFLLVASIMDTWDIEKDSDITYPNETYKEYEKRSRLEMFEAQDAATIIALQKAGYEINIKKERTIVTYITEEAKTNIKLNDEIISINDQKVNSMIELKKIINSYKKDDKLKIMVSRDDKEIECYAKLYERDDVRYVGIQIVKSYDYDSDIDVNVKSKRNESGPSGGLMTALAIYNSLVPEDITNGNKIIGTGTIDILGNVGAIGGVKYKLLGAEKNKGDVFLVPIDNYKEALEVKKEYDLDIKLIAVATIDEAIASLNKI